MIAIPKPFLLLVLLIFTINTYAQLEDNFSDGDFSNNPTWNGSTAKFTVNDDFRLQLNDDVANQSHLTTIQTETSLNNREWRFYIKQSFSGSSNNYSRVYLSSSSDDLSFSGDQGASTEGYFLLFGESGSDDAIHLFKNEANNTITEIGFGTAGFISSSFEITIRVVRDELGNWSVYADENAGEDFALQFTGFDNSFTTTAYLGMVCNYTVSNSNNFYFDDFYFGDEIVDTEIPELVSVEVVSGLELDLLFSEPVDAVSAQFLTNYSVSGIGNPTNVIVDGANPALVHLVFSTPFTEGETLTITVENITDLSNNIMVSTDMDFMYFVPALGEFREIVFSEIMADPNPTVNLPEVEYVELKNNSDETFDLENWTFVNTTTEKTLGSFVLEPGALVILCDANDADSLMSFGDVLPITSFTALTNSGDSLTLLNAEGILIDWISYSSSWYNNSELDDGGYSLVNTSYESTCVWNEQNWTATTSVDGGTPGIDNLSISVPDNQAPQPLDVILLNTTEITVSFDEILDESTIVLANFNLNGGIDIESVVVNPTNPSQVILTLDVPINFGEEYILTINDIADCEGDLMQDSFDFTFIIGFQAEIGDVIINEIMADPDDDFPSPNVEYVELYNKSNKLIELKGAFFTSTEITEAFLLEPNSYLIITDIENEGIFTADLNVLFLEGMVVLTNSGRELELVNQEGEEVDQLIYNLDWYHDISKDDGGYALERINTNDPCSDIDNWRASDALSGSTEGIINSINDNSPDETAPTALYSYTWNSNSIEVIFDEQVSGFSLQNASAEAFRVANGTTIFLDNPINYLSSASANSIFVLFEESFNAEFVWSLSISGVEDCWGNAADDQIILFAISEDYQSNDILINEVLFNPRENGKDYIEIYNNSDRNINLQDWFLANVTDDGVDNFERITEFPRLLFAHQYLVLTENEQAVSDNYPFAKINNFLIMESLPTYANSEGTVVLINDQSEVADSLVYNEDLHFELLNEEKGVSLERLSFDRSTTDNSNWHSAAESQNFGTPGYQNSQFTEEETSDEFITVFPEIFSPDNDGFEDVVTFSYSFDKPGFLVSITLYDKDGRLVKDLVQNELAGIDNSISWDGIKDNNHLAPMGIYVVLVEYFDLDGNVEYEKTVCVVGHQL